MAQIIIRNQDKPDLGSYLFDETYGWKRWVSGGEGRIRGAFAQAGAQLDAAAEMNVDDTTWNEIPELVIEDGYYRIK
jgi:hypothetical protein